MKILINEAENIVHNWKNAPFQTRDIRMSFFLIVVLVKSKAEVIIIVIVISGLVKNICLLQENLSWSNRHLESASPVGTSIPDFQAVCVQKYSYLVF